MHFDIYLFEEHNLAIILEKLLCEKKITIIIINNTAARSEIARRSKDTADRMKERMREAKEEVETEQQNKLDISSGKLSSELTIIKSRCLCWSFRVKLVTKPKQIGDLTTKQAADISSEN